MNTSQNIPLTELFKGIESVLVDAGYSSPTINAYASALRRLERHCKGRGKSTFNEKLVLGYLDELAHLYKSGKMSWSFMRLSRKSTLMLMQLAQDEIVYLGRYKHPEKSVSDYYETLLCGFRKHLDLTSNVTVKIKNRKTRECRKFFTYLESLNIFNVTDITLKIADDYATDSAKRLGISAMVNRYNSLREMCKYLEYAGIPYFDFSPALNMRPSKRTKVMPAFSHSQVRAISDSIDYSLDNAKRDFAMFKIAEKYGMRATDIVALKLADIDWRTNEIKIIQTKTKSELVLPLKAEVGNAISDYILSERPKSKSKHIFLRSLAPYERLDSETVMSRLVKYMSIADVCHAYGSGLGTHSYRRYVASQMLDNGVPMDTVSQVLGHTNIISLKPYIRVSKKRLKECSLDLGRVGITGGLRYELSI